MGPAERCPVVLVKVLLKFMIQGTDTAFVGELMNIVGSICFVLPASLIYRKVHTRKGAMISLTVSSIFESIVFINILSCLPHVCGTVRYAYGGDYLYGNSSCRVVNDKCNY